MAKEKIAGHLRGWRPSASSQISRAIEWASIAGHRRCTGGPVPRNGTAARMEPGCNRGSSITAMTGAAAAAGMKWNEALPGCEAWSVSMPG